MNRAVFARLAGGALVTSTLLTACERAPTADAAALFNACTNAMVSNTCRVMQDKGQSLVPPGATTIFVAGIGPIDAELYKRLRESGEGMCAQVRDVCARDWTSAQCKTARTLYGVP